MELVGEVSVLVDISDRLIVGFSPWLLASSNHPLCKHYLCHCVCTKARGTIATEIEDQAKEVTEGECIDVRENLVIPLYVWLVEGFVTFHETGRVVRLR